MIFDSRSSNSTLIHQLYYSASTWLRSQTFSIPLNNESRVGTPLCRYLETTNRPKLQCATNEYADPLINKLEEIFFCIQRFSTFLEWQPCHSPVILFCSSRWIYQGFSQRQLWGTLVFLSPISNYFKMAWEMAQL